MNLLVHQDEKKAGAHVSAPIVSPNALGFLGGINYAILVASVCQCYVNASPSTLLRKVFLLLTQCGDQSHIIGNNGRQWIRQEAHGQLELKIERTNGLDMKVSAFPNFISVV
jgi:hypothetical protein